MEYRAFPGGDLIRGGIEDLEAGLDSPQALLVAIGQPRLSRLGVPVPPHPFASPEQRLYQTLAQADPDAAHARYNGLIRRLVSFERAMECAGLADAQRIQQLMRALGAEADEATRLYFTGGATAVLIRWRPTTIDVDIRLFPETDRLLRAIPHLKEQLQLNIELACPADFIPELPGWEDRSQYVASEGRLTAYHYDFYAQALAKIERGHSQDLQDVRAMLERGLIEPRMVRCHFDDIEPRLYRYPAIHPPSFRRAVEDMLA